MKEEQKNTGEEEDIDLVISRHLSEEKNNTVYLDEALEILGKFLKQTVKDYISPSLRFSRLSAERQYWETARRFIFGETAVEWGENYFSFQDAISILNIDADWLLPNLEQERISREIKYLNKGRKKKKDSMAIIIYINCPENIRQTLRSKLKKMGLLPVFSITTPDTDSYKEADIEELRNLSLENNTFFEEEENIRKRIDRNLLLLKKTDLALFIWTPGVNELQVLTEAALCYQAYIPTFLLAAPDAPPIEKEILAYISQIRFTSEDMMEALRQIVGSGRATIQSTIRAKLSDIIDR